MSKIIEIFKLDMKLSLRKIKMKGSKSRDIGKSLLYILTFIGLIFLYIFYIQGILTTYKILEYFNQQEIFLQIGIILNQIIMLVFGIPYILGKYYFSNDIEQLMPLPIESHHVLGGKSLSLLVQEYMLSIPMILPFIVIHGLGEKLAFGYWLRSILVILFLPIIPLSILSILVLLLMRYTNIGSKKDLLRVLGSLILVVVIVYIQMKIQSLIQISMDEFDNLDGMVNELVDSFLIYSKIYPPIMWSTQFLLNSYMITRLINATLFFASSAIIYLLMLKVGSKVFYKGLMEGNEHTYKKDKNKKQNTRNKYKPNKAYISLAKKELIMIIKTPIYLMNTIMALLIMPVIMIMSVVMASEVDIGILLRDMESFYSTNKAYFILGAIGIVIGFNLFNTASSTTFSREGKSIWLQRSLPIKAKDQVKGRVLSGLILQSVISIFASVFALVIFKSSIGESLVIFIMSLLGSIPLTMLLIYVDISRPLLDWDSPQEAMKENFNVLIGMIITIFYLAILVGITIVMFKFNMSLEFILLLSFIIFILVSKVGLEQLSKKVEKELLNLE